MKKGLDFAPEEVIQLKSTDIRNIREEILKEQNFVCPICKETIDLKDACLDHLHKSNKDQKLIKNGVGLIRGVLHKSCNAFDGKILKDFIRLGLHKKNLDFPDILRNLADYLQKDKYPFIHPTEEDKPKKLSKRNFKILKKAYEEKRLRKKFPEFPKSGKMIKRLEKYYKDFGINPYNKT